MSITTAIEWTDATWNPVTGCTRVSEGCRNCYMARIIPRQGQDPWTVVLHLDRIEQPLKWKKSRRIFVNSLSDLFHEDVTDRFIEDVWASMCIADHHTYQILTKRPQRLHDWLVNQDWERIGAIVANKSPMAAHRALARKRAGFRMFEHVWLGVSIENQETADERIPILLQTPAAVRFVSYEPALGPVNLRYVNPYDDFHIDALDTPDPSCRLNWVIAGGESGPGARPAHPSWFRSIRDQCQGAGVPYFFKQWGEWRPETLAELADTKNTEKSLQLRESGERLPCGQGAVYRDGVIMRRVGKQAAGAQLDGREWREFPA